ncbi:hypothetical protein FRB90_001902 [Tulasnella sp. 427]|nr:hypothetical protein FRB90_001902 [Tulasnella sp. 427]
MATHVVVSYVLQDTSGGLRGRALLIETKPEVRIRTMQRRAVRESPGFNILVSLHEKGDWKNVVESLDFGRLPNNLTVRFRGLRGFRGKDPGEDEQLAQSWITTMGEGGAAFESMEFDSGFDPIPVLRYLSTPQIDQDGSQYWPCPRLKTIIARATSTWTDARTNELEQACIAFLRRSSSTQDGLTPPRQVEEMLIHHGRTPSTLESMQEFTGVKFSPQRGVASI